MTARHQLAYALFTIYQEAEPPEFWTEYFGVEPSSHASDYPLRPGTWSLSSEDGVESDDLAPHLRYLVNRLELPRRDLRGLIERTGAHLRVFCYWNNEAGNRVPDVPDDVREMVEVMGGSVEIDEYRYR